MSLHLSKCHIVGNHMPRLKLFYISIPQKTIFKTCSNGMVLLNKIANRAKKKKKLFPFANFSIKAKKFCYQDISKIIMVRIFKLGQLIDVE